MQRGKEAEDLQELGEKGHCKSAAKCDALTHKVAEKLTMSTGHSG